MSCGHIGKKSKLPCLGQTPDHLGKHYYVYRQLRTSRTSTKKEQAALIPAARLPEAGLAALERYSQLAKPGETMYTEIMERLWTRA